MAASPLHRFTAVTGLDGNIVWLGLIWVKLLFTSIHIAQARAQLWSNTNSIKDGLVCQGLNVMPLSRCDDVAHGSCRIEGDKLLLHGLLLWEFEGVSVPTCD